MKKFKNLALLSLLLGFPLTAFGAVDSGDTAWILVSTALVMLMTPGLAFFYGGMVRDKNVVGMLFQNWVALPVLGLLWAIIGYSLAFPGDLQHVLLNGVGMEPSSEDGTIPHLLFMAFQMMFAIITPILMTGAFAERSNFKSWLLVMVAWSLCVYYPVCHWVWGEGGWLAGLGAVDFAGGYVVHMTAGFSALVAAIVYGRRKEFGKDLSQYDTGMIALGTGLLYFGWFGFNAGSSLAANGQAANAFVTTFLSGASAFATWTLFDWAKDGKPNLTGACIGAVVGLVVVTPGAGFVSANAAMIMGAVGGVVCNFVARFVKGTLNIDDSLDVFACHGVGGTLGILMTGLFAKESIGGVSGLFAGNPSQFVNQAIGAAAVAVYSAVVTFVILKIVNAIVSLRVSETDEDTGLDNSCHGENIVNIHNYDKSA